MNSIEFLAAICTTMNSKIDFSFKNDLDYESQMFVKY